MLKIIIMISISLLCIATINAQSNKVTTGTSSISGTITSKGQPVRKASIYLMHQSEDRRGASQSLTGKTDSTGTYRITGIKAGQYEIKVSAPPLIFRSGDRWARETLNISDNENLENLDFELNIGGVITGIITGPDGRPMIETFVTLKRVREKGQSQPLYLSPSQMQVTDDRGVYRIYGLPKGQYIACVGIKIEQGSIHMTPESTYSPITYYGDTSDESKAKIIEVDEGIETNRIDIQTKEIKKFHGVGGRVIYAESDAPIPGIALSMGSLSKSGDGSKERVRAFGCCSEPSNENGEYKFRSALPGRFAIFYRHERFNSNDAKSSLNNYYSQSAIVEITNSDVEGVDIKFFRGSTISGNIVFEGAQGDISKLSKLKIHANLIDDINNDDPIVGFASTMDGNINSDGSFIISGLRPGKIQLKLERNQFVIDRIEHNGQQILKKPGEGIDVTQGNNISGVRVIISPIGKLQLNGEIKIINGKLPESAVVVAIAKKVGDENQYGNIGSVDTRGKFTINQLTEGDYEISFGTNSFAANSEEFKRIQSILNQAKKPVRVTSGSTQTVTFTVDPGSLNQ